MTRRSFREPNSLAWQYKKPYDYSIIFKSGKIYINDEGKKSQMDAKSNKTFAKINKLIVGSVSGQLFDDKEFTITGIEDCVARGYERSGFFEVDTGDQKSWTVQLTEPARTAAAAGKTG